MSTNVERQLTVAHFTVGHPAVYPFIYYSVLSLSTLYKILKNTMNKRLVMRLRVENGSHYDILILHIFELHAMPDQPKGPLGPGPAPRGAPHLEDASE